MSALKVPPVVPRDAAFPVRKKATPLIRMRFKLTLKHPINIKADGSGQTQSAVWLDEASKCKEVSRWWHYAHWLCYYVCFFFFFLRWCSLKVFPLLSSGSWREACVRQSGLNRDGGSSRVLLNPPPLISDAPLLISPPQLRKKTLLVMLRSNDSKLRQPEKGEEGKKKEKKRERVRKSRLALNVFLKRRSMGFTAIYL